MSSYFLAYFNPPFYVRATCRVFLTSLPRFSSEGPKKKYRGWGSWNGKIFFICFRSNFLLRRTCNASPSPCAACCGVHHITVLSYQRTAPPPDRLCSPELILFCGEQLFRVDVFNPSRSGQNFGHATFTPAALDPVICVACLSPLLRRIETVCPFFRHSFTFFHSIQRHRSFLTYFPGACCRLLVL